jgi:hypothetical protein
VSHDIPTSAEEDIRLLQLDAIAEYLQMVAIYAGHGIDHISGDDQAGLQASLYRTSKCLNAAVATWRDMRPAARLPGDRVGG